MELQFERKDVSFLHGGVREVQNLEATQEVKLSDGMPDVGRILAAWGQGILRGKEWRSDSILASGGVMAWVLYAPEDGSAPRCLSAWIPFQMKWDLPEDTPEGSIRVCCRIRSVDARSVSPRKVMVRCGVAALGESWSQGSAQVFAPGEIPAGVELLKRRYPVRLAMEAGEKTFRLEETLTLSGQTPDKLVYCSLTPEIEDRKVMTDKAVFRGSGNLHVLCAGENGVLTAQDFQLPFSQFADLKGSYGSGAGVDIVPAVTELEADVDEEGAVRVKAGLVAQYLVEDAVMVEAVEDAYARDRELTLSRETLEVPASLGSSEETVTAEQTAAGQDSTVLDASILPDFPRQRGTGDERSLVFPGTYQILCQGEDGALQGLTGRWEQEKSFPFAQDSGVTAIPRKPAPAAVSFGGGNMSLRAEIPVTLSAWSGAGIPMVTGGELGEEREPDPDRPSLILRRAGEGGLWELAKANGSTMEAIQKANGIEGEPAPGQMLLIPVP